MYSEVPSQLSHKARLELDVTGLKAGNMLIVFGVNVGMHSVLALLIDHNLVNFDIDSGVP